MILMNNKKILVRIIFFLLISTSLFGLSMHAEDSKNYNVGKNKEDFHDYDSTTSELQQIASTYPEIANLYDLGESVEGRTIWGLKITNNPDIEEFEPEVRICGAHHGDEYMSVELPLLLAWYLTENYTSNSTIKGLVDNHEIWIIPLVNPDGREAGSRYNANGIDLNRDYGFMWNVYAECFTQPETQVIRENALDNNFVVSLSFHTAGDVVNYLWNYKGDPAVDHDLIDQLSEQYGSHNGYWVVEGYDWYQTRGDTNDFSYGCRGDIDWTIETNNSNIPATWNQNQQAMIEIIEASDIGLTGIVTDNITGEPINATVWIEQAYWPCFTDPKIGDYHRLLLPGNYTVHFTANGYETQIHLIQVQNSSVSTFFNVSLDRANNYYAHQITMVRYIDAYGYPNNFQNNPTEAISALGAPDGICSSLGIGGVTVLDMNDHIVNEPETDDFTIYEGDGSDDGYHVHVSKTWDGPWIDLGSGFGTTTFDLEDGSIDWARFVKIRDDYDGDQYEQNPGCDIDAVAITNCGNEPQLLYSPTSYYAGILTQNETNTTQFQIWNGNAVLLNYSMIETCDWIEVTPIQGNSTGEHDSITVDIDTTGMSAGSHHYDIVISSNGGSGVFGVDVYVVVGPPPPSLEQTSFDRGFPIRHAVDGDWAGAQSFTPEYDIINSIDVFLRVFGVPEFDLIVELRKNSPDGVLLDSTVFTPEELSTNWNWLNVPTDIYTEPDVEYYIVIPPAPSGVTTSFGYEWGYAFDNQYNDGAFWFTRDGGGLWRDLPTMYEFTFKVNWLW